LKPTASEKPLDAEEAVGRVLAGETEAFAEIVRRYQREIWRVAAAMLGDRLMTENLVQQTFVNAYERLEQYERGRGLEQWLKAIARNLVREELRRSSRERRRMDCYRDYLLSLYDDQDEAERQQRRYETALRSCRQDLADAAGRALQMRYEEALPIEAVASSLGRTLAATRQLLFRAREALRVCVEEKLAAD
jgi:RNA polymerase sigma-70 factor (ECF subfamily)